jgi:hypothetical protein
MRDGYRTNRRGGSSRDRAKTMNTTSRLTLLLVAFGVCVFSQSVVFERDGRVWLRTESGELSALTSGLRDTQPWITRDGKEVLFCRVDPTDDFQTAVYAVGTTTRKERLLFDGPVKYKDELIRYLGWPSLDTEGDTLYVLARHSMTSGALFAVDLRTLKAQYLTEAAEYAAIQWPGPRQVTGESTKIRGTA